jgi:hypothetical protein
MAANAHRQRDNLAQLGGPMQLINECLERAAHFQTLADAETDPKLKEQLIGQSRAYLKLAGKRAKELGLPAPSLPQKS